MDKKTPKFGFCPLWAVQVINRVRPDGFFRSRYFVSVHAFFCNRLESIPVIRIYSGAMRFQVEVTEKKFCIQNLPDLGSRPRKIDLSPRMSNFIPSPNPSKSPLWNVLKVTLEPSDHLVWSWGPPGGHGPVGHLTHFQIFFAFFQSRIKKNYVHGRWVIGPLNRRSSAQGILNWSQIIFCFRRS